MSLKIKPAAEITYDQASYLIYGNQGVGKTTSLKYLPGKTLVIDVDKSSSVLAGEEDIDILEINTADIWDEWNTVVAELIQDKSFAEIYDNIVLDNISELFRSSLEDLGKRGKPQQRGVPGMQDYQRVDYLIMRAIRALKSLNVRLVITAWETTQEFTDETGQSFNRYVPDMRRGIMNNLLGLMDVVGRVVIKKTEDDGIVRGFILQPSASTVAKNRLDDRRGCEVSELVTLRE